MGRSGGGRGRVLANAPAIAGQLARELVENPSRLWVLGLRLLPPRAGSRVLGALPQDSLHRQFLSHWTSGRHQEARDTLLRAGQRGRPGRTRAAVGLALAVDDAVTAGLLLDRVPEPDPSLAGLALWSAGSITAAEQAARRPASGLRRPAAAITRARLAGQRAALDPGWRAGGLGERGYPPVAPAPNTVLHLVTNSFPQWTTGYAVRTHEIVTAQAAAGLSPHVVTRLGFPVNQGFLDAGPLDVVDGIPYHRLLTRGPAPWTEDRDLQRNVRAGLALARRLRPALLHAASKHTNGQVALEVARVLDLPVAYEVRGFLEETWISRQGDAGRLTDRYRMSRAVETACMRRADVVFTLGSGMAHEIAARGIDPSRICVVPNCAGDRYFAPLPDPGALRSRLGIQPDDVVVGLLTNVVGYEGIDTLIAAVAALRARGEAVTLLVVGDGLELDRLRALAAQQGLGRFAVLPGRVPYSAVPEHLAAIDIYCVPRHDTAVTRLVTPLKPLEAMAAGRPIVVSDLPALAEIVQDGWTGRLVRPGDPHELAAVLSDLAHDPALRSALAGRARTWARENRSWRSNVTRYAAAYRSIGADVAEVPPAGAGEGP